MALCAARAESLAGGTGPSADTGTASLVSEVKTVAPGSTFIVALHLDLPRHWHTYWRFAGDSGAPPTLQWKLPPGFAASNILWPIPERISIPPFMNFAYVGTVDFMVPMTAPTELAAGVPIELALRADWLVCSQEVCIPRSGDFNLHLAAAASGAAPVPDLQWSAALVTAAERLAHPSPYSVSLIVDKTDLELYIKDAKLAAALKSGAVRTLEFYPYQDGIIQHASAQTVLAGAQGVALRIPSSYLFTENKAPDPLPGLLVIERKDGVRTGYEIWAHHGNAIGGLTPMPASDAAANGMSGFLLAAGFALIGGLILNLMPCVFPVLSMKILSFLKLGGEAAPALRRHGWLYTAGVLMSFLALGAGLYVLRAGGAAIGWGYQLQSPVTVLFLAYLMFALGLSLLGLLTIGGSVMGLGQSLTARSGAFGDFMTGVLASVVATPCTAPFMGAALGFAFVAPPLEGALVFLCLGAGLALPYLVLTHLPHVLKLLPRPGVWMERLKQLLAAPMLASSAWLLWVLARQVSNVAFVAALGGLALIAFAAWAIRPSRRASVRAWSGRAAAALALIVPLALAWLPAPAESGRADPHQLTNGDWTPYSPARLDAALTSGRPVFVDLTAAWCLTCKINEWSALASSRVEAKFNAARVLRLRGDWTNGDPEITALLTEHDRIGVPLYLFYPAGGKAAKVLPQILTEDIVLDALGE